MQFTVTSEEGNSKRKRKRSQRDDTRWWPAPKDDPEELARLVVAAFTQLDESKRAHQDAIVDAYCLYGDETAVSGNYVENKRGSATRNVIASGVDTIVSGTTQTKPRPMFVTIGGDWFDRERARTLTKHCEAEFDEADVYSLAEQVDRDAVVAGLGILRPYIDRQYKLPRVKCDRIFPAHLLVDDRGSLYCRSM